MKASLVRQPTKVLVLIPALDVGGAEMDLVRVLPRLDRTRFKVAVCAFMHKGALAQRLVQSGIEVVGPGDLLAHRASRTLSVSPPRDAPDRRPTPTAAKAPAPWHAVRKSIASVRSILRQARAVARFIRDREIDLVHTMLPSAYLIGVLGNMLAGRRPLAMSRVSLNWYHQKHRLFRIAELKFLHFCLDVAIGNSKAILKDLRAEGVPDPKLRLVYNGIDCAGFVAQLLDRQAARERMGVGAATLVLTSVANLHSYKGHADLLRALSLVRERLPADWALLIAGRDVDNNLAMLRTLSEELGISAHVRFLGERGDVPVILSAADIHVSASHTEGLPNNILEAMCAGLPIVATSVGGVPEQLIDREHGILVPPNDPGCLAAAIATLANDPAARSKLGGAARDRVERAFGIERAVVALEEVYGSLNARSGCIRSAG